MRNKSELRPYQNRIATALYESDEKIAVARPGGGKTVAALTAIERADPRQTHPSRPGDRAEAGGAHGLAGRDQRYGRTPPGCHTRC